MIATGAFSLWEDELLRVPDALAACLVLIAMVSVARRKIGLFMISFFVFFSFAARMISVLFIDFAGPVVSEQLERSIGPGPAAVPLGLSQAMVIAALIYSFRDGRLSALSRGPRLSAMLPAGRLPLPDLALWMAGLFALGLWIELLIRGPIPLFAAMERYDYSRLYGGPLHHRMIEWGAMLAFQLGIFFAAPAFRGRRFDRRFGVLLGILILYLFAVGQRFSSFYSLFSFFIMPVGAVLLGSGAKVPGGPGHARMLGTLKVAVVALLLLVSFALAYSYTVVRGFEGAQLFFKLWQRILVQPGEMWWMTYERVFLHGEWSTSQAFSKLFIDPFDPGRNSTMQLLMEQGLPLDRAHFILGQGSAYTGGWPEVLFELGGPVGGFVLVAFSAILLSEFMFLTTRCIVQERYATCVFLTPVLYALSLYPVTGMVNSFIQLTFMLKLAVALFVYVAEERWRLGLSMATSPVSTKEMAGAA